MHAVMKHFDVMIGIDHHKCWPPKAPRPLPRPQPYLTIMVLHGIQPLTPMMAYSCMTVDGFTMQRGTDIGPGIPHIGMPSKLTPMDIALSSSISYFGPASYAVEGVPCAAALLSHVNLNMNCAYEFSRPTGLVICPTTHFCGMTAMDILYGFACIAVDLAFEALTDWSVGMLGMLGGAAKKRVVGAVSDRIASKSASKTASKSAPSPTIGSHRPGARTGPRRSGAPVDRPGSSAPAPPGTRPSGAPGPGRPSWQQPARPAGPRPHEGPQLGPQRPRPQQPWKPATPVGPRPPDGPQLSPQRPQQPWKPATPSKPPPDVWVPGKPTQQQHPPSAPTISPQRPGTDQTVPSTWQLYKDMTPDLLLELLISVPMSIPHQMTMNLLPLTNIEEFGAPREGQET